MASEESSGDVHDAGTWAGLTQRLAAVIPRLQHREYVVLTDLTDSSRYVQALRSGTVLTVECSGSTVDGGPAKLSTHTQAALLDLGWPPVQDDGYPNYRDYWISPGASMHGWEEPVGAGEVASLMLDSLRVLGLTSPDRLEVVRQTNTDARYGALPTEQELAEVEERVAERRSRQQRGDA